LKLKCTAALKRRQREKRYTYGVLVGKPEGKNRLEDKDTDGKIILNWIFKKEDGRTYAGIIWLRIGTGGELL
jgi:hypothetical protein